MAIADERYLLRNVTVLLSGGLDSSLCAELAHQQGRLRNCLHIHYGQPASAQEARCSRAVADSLGVQCFVRQGVGTADAMATGVGEPGPRVVPGRNLWMASIAISYALETGSTSVWLGCNADDAKNYPDCRPAFIEALNAMAQATYGVEVAAPLMLRTKKDIVRKWLALGRDLDETWSCYQPREVPWTKDVPCGTCDACVLRADAIAADKRGW